MDCSIIVESVRKVYRTTVRDTGLLPAVKSLLKPSITEVMAVDDICFSLKQGEMVGFIGPNGAGKTTTLKMLSGLLHPTSGDIRAAGFKPWERKPSYLRQIGFLMGNKSQLTWDNTIGDSFFILKEIYGVNDSEYRQRLAELTELLELGSLLNKLSRTLSLGERARCELASVLIHNPGILYLDEPTLGLDVSMQLKLRDFIREYNRKYGTTVIITSHYMSDIVSLCPRVMLINKGKLAYDGALSGLAEKVAPFRLIKLRLPASLEGAQDALITGQTELQAELIESVDCERTYRVRKENILPFTAYLLESSITDLTIEDPPMEAVIDQVYRNGISEAVPGGTTPGGTIPDGTGTARPEGRDS